MKIKDFAALVLNSQGHAHRFTFCVFGSLEIIKLDVPNLRF